MPELPDVECFRRYVARTSLHQPIAAVGVRDEHVLEATQPAALQRALVGHRFLTARRHAKYLFLGIDTGQWLSLHFGMTGFPRCYKRPEREPRHTRLLIGFANGYHLAYDCQRRLGHIRLTDDPQIVLAEHRVGPDAIQDLDAERFAERLRGRRGSLKTILMNQAVIGGIGNLYSDEILHQAGLHPATPVARLDGPALRRLYGVLRDVLGKAVELGADPETFPDDWLLPHRTGDERCGSCGGPLQTMKIAGRTSHFCTRCQPEP